MAVFENSGVTGTLRSPYKHVTSGEVVRRHILFSSGTLWRCAVNGLTYWTQFICFERGGQAKEQVRHFRGDARDI